MSAYTCNRCGRALIFGPENRFVFCMWCWFAHGIEVNLHDWRTAFLDETKVRKLLVRQYHRHMERWLERRKQMQLMVI